MRIGAVAHEAERKTGVAMGAIDAQAIRPERRGDDSTGIEQRRIGLKRLTGSGQRHGDGVGRHETHPAVIPDDHGGREWSGAGGLRLNSLLHQQSPRLVLELARIHREDRLGGCLIDCPTPREDRTILRLDQPQLELRWIQAGHDHANAKGLTLTGE